MAAVAASVLPLKRYAEFRGRSTRGELAAFYVLVIITNVVIGYAGVVIGFEVQQWVQSGLSLLLLCPTVALGVRRLHDSGWSGWWLMLGLPATAVGTWEFFTRHGPWARPVHLEFRWWIDVPLGLTGVALITLLLLNDDPDTNRYGPNPRTGPIGEPA